MVEEEVIASDGEKSIRMKLERQICGITSSISQVSLTIHLFDISTSVESVTDRKLIYGSQNTFDFDTK